jgi:hypothetical protein
MRSPGCWTSTAARVRRRRLVHLISSAHRDEQQRRKRQACKERLVREGKAHAALVSGCDLAVAWCQARPVPRPSSPATRLDRSDCAAPGGAVVAALSLISGSVCPADDADNLACIADVRCYGVQGAGPSEEESAR